MRFSAFLIGLCMVIIAASVGAVAYLAAGFSTTEAAACGVTALSLLTAYNAFAGRARDRADIAQRITDLSRGTADLARQVGEQGRRLHAAEAALAQSPERTRGATEPLAADIEVLGTLVKQLADSVAVHEAMLVGGARPSPSIAPDIVSRVDSEPLPQALVPEEQEDEVAETPQTGSEMQRIIRAALEANRVDLYLQPIVTLPQRKVRFYEAMSRLRTEDGGTLVPADYLRPAEAGGLMPLLDNLMLFRSVQVVRRLTSKNRDAGLFCNIASATLTDAEFFAQFYEFLSANRALAPALVFEFSQQAWRAMGPIEHESLAQLSDLGFRFSLDQLTDLQLDPRALFEQSFRFIKAPAALLLGRSVATTSDIHTSDFANLLARYGIDLIVEKVEAESTVIDLLDYDVKFAQGYLFAPPRPVRNEVFVGGPDRPNLTLLSDAKLQRSSNPVASPEQPPPSTHSPTETSPQPSARDTSGLVKLARAFGRKV